MNIRGLVWNRADKTQTSIAKLVEGYLLSLRMSTNKWYHYWGLVI